MRGHITAHTVHISPPTTAVTAMVTAKATARTLHTATTVRPQHSQEHCWKLVRVMSDVKGK